MPPAAPRWHQEPEAAGLRREALERAMALLAAGTEDGRHNGAQLYVGQHGRPVLEYACGEAAPGRTLTPDSLLPWFSASKPVTAMAIAWLLDRGLLALDDPVRRYLPAFGAGKEACTLRHVLTHQGGFAGALTHADVRPWDEMIAAICAYPAEYPPGTRAGYHPTAGWMVLGEVVHVVDGRPIDRFVAEELFAPLGLGEAHMGVSEARLGPLRPRMALVHLGRAEGEPFVNEAFIAQNNDPAEWARVKPSGGIRGPARDLGRFYDMLLSRGRTAAGELLIDPRSVALFTACHRWGLPDRTLMNAQLAWGLGFGLYGNADVHPSASRRVFNHSGMVSSVALGDPERGLSCVVLTTGLLPPLANARRLREVNGAVLAACDPGPPPT